MHHDTRPASKILTMTRCQGLPDNEWEIQGVGCLELSTVQASGSRLLVACMRPQDKDPMSTRELSNSAQASRQPDPAKQSPQPTLLPQVSTSTVHLGNATQAIPQLLVINPLPRETEQTLCVQDDLSLRKSYHQDLLRARFPAKKCGIQGPEPSPSPGAQNSAQPKGRHKRVNSQQQIATNWVKWAVDGRAQLALRPPPALRPVLITQSGMPALPRVPWLRAWQSRGC